MVMLSRVETRPAARVVFAPAQENLRLQGSANALKRSFFGRPLVAGDTVATAGQQRLPSGDMPPQLRQMLNAPAYALAEVRLLVVRSEEHTSELQSLMRISYAVFCLKKKKHKTDRNSTHWQRTNHKQTSS